MTREEILKVTESRNHKVKNSWGVYDAYKWIRKHQWFNIGRPLLEHEFYSIIRTVNKILAEYIEEGMAVKLPCRMGELALRKAKNFIKLEDGKLITNKPVDWDRTLKLWCEDKQAYTDKILVRDDKSKYTYRIVYIKYKANYNNKLYMEFKPNRVIKRTVTTKLNNGITDALARW